VQTDEGILESRNSTEGSKQGRSPYTNINDKKVVSKSDINKQITYKIKSLESSLSLTVYNVSSTCIYL
jgi:hypothetical protein